MTTTAAPTTIDEVGEFLATLLATPPDRLTNCRGWTVHDLVAHLAAGAAEQADLIEDHLAGAASRATRPFDEREPPYRALADTELRDRLVTEATRFAAAQAALGDDAVTFTGRPMTAQEFAMHGRSECALHRWDIVGRDDEGWAALSQPVLTHHALSVLTTMSTLAEAPANRLPRTAATDGVQLILRSEPQDDIVVTMSGGIPCMESHPISDVPAHLTLEPAARLLLLWGRREPSAPITLHAAARERMLLEQLVPRVS